MNNFELANLHFKYQDLQLEVMKLDKFFTMYLDKFSKKLDPEKPNTPIWKLYKQKTKEYHDLCRELRITDYYIKRKTNV
jgi:hypothetical protein